MIKEKMIYCLVSTSGDMSKRGIGNKNTVILFDKKHRKIVSDYLRAELEWKLYSYFEWEKIGNKNQNKIYYNNLSKSFEKLRDAKIFNHKYDFRTSWDLALWGELDRYEPYQVSDESKHLLNDEFIVDKRLKSKKFTALHLSERFGTDIPPKKLLNYKICKDFIFFKCDEKYLDQNSFYDDEDSEIKVFSMHLNNIYGEIYDEYDPKKFSFLKKNLEKLVESYN